MKKIYTLLFVLVTLLFPVLLKAQGKGELLKLTFAGPEEGKEADAGYFIMHDTLFTGKSIQNYKIAIADINFGMKLILPSALKEEDTNEPVYRIVISPQAGKSVSKSFGVFSYYSGSDNRNQPVTDTMYVYVAGKDAAFKEFDRLKDYAAGKIRDRYTAKTTGKKKNEVLAAPASAAGNYSYQDDKEFMKMLDEWSATDSKIEKKEGNAEVKTDKSRLDEVKAAMSRINFGGGAEKEEDKPAEKTASVSLASGNFDAQLAELMNGAKNRFRDLKGAADKSGNFLSKVQLAGSVKTQIVTGALQDVAVVADLGEFKTREEGLPVYKKFIESIQMASGLPAMMIKMDEQSNEVTRITPMIAFGAPDELKNIKFYIELGKAASFDKQLNKTDIWFLSLRIEP